MEAQQAFSDYEPLGIGPHQRFQFCPVCGGKLSFQMVHDRLRQHCTGCGFIFFHNPAPGVAVMVVDDGRVLLTRRSTTHLGRQTKWCLPGGHLEWGEDYLTCGIREVKEETSIDVEIQSIISVHSNFYDPNSHYVVVVLLAKVIGGTAKADNLETDLVGWFLPLELPDLGFEGDRHIIARYFENPFPGVPVDPRLARKQA